MRKLLTAEAAKKVFSTEAGQEFFNKGNVHYLSYGDKHAKDPSRAPISNQWSGSKDSIDPVAALHTVQNAEAEIVSKSKNGLQR